jgi:hypothetical protein
MMDEFKLIDQVKEELCYVSTDMIGELKRTKVMRNGARRAIDTEDPFGLPLKRNFVLPDFQSIQRGYVKPYDEMMRDSEQVNMDYYIASFKCLHAHVLYHYNNN